MQTLIVYKVLESKAITPDQQQSGVIADEHIIAGGDYRKDKMQARRITYQDPESKNQLIYRRRWLLQLAFLFLPDNSTL